MIQKISAIRLIVLLVAALSLSLSTKIAASDSQKLIDWNDEGLNWYSYEEGIAKIKETGKPGLLVIYADWCSACQAHSKDFFNDRIISRLDDVILIRVNKDDNQKINDKYDFDGTYIPRVFALDGNSDVIHKLYDLEDQYAYFYPTITVSSFEKLLVDTKEYVRP